MIDTTTESLISLPEALKFLPPGRRNKRPHLSTLIRWINDGVNGIHLEAVRLGGRWVTSREAIQRFCERLTPALDRAAAEIPRAPAARQRASEKAGRQLEKIGI
jgi:hypothetical protein